VWLYEAWVISGYLAAVRVRVMGPALPPGVELEPFLRLMDPRIGTAESVQHLALIAALGFGIAGVGFLVPRLARVFTIQMVNGKAKVTQGKVAQVFVDDLAECCRESGVWDGAVWGQLTHRGIQLGFSDEIPAGVRQRLRNLWVQYAPGPRRG